MLTCGVDCGMAASPAGKMTGANKTLVGDFVALKLVEREIAWALAAGEIPRDDKLAARDAVVDWAQAYGGSNLRIALTELQKTGRGRREKVL